MGGAMTSSAQAVDWTGFYAGVLGSVGVQVGTNFADYHFLGVYKLVGYEWRSGDLVFGIEDMLGFEQDYNFGAPFSNYFWWQKTGRLGVLVSDDLLLYGTAGIGVVIDGAVWFGIAGAGAEFAVSENLSLRGQYQAEFRLSGSGAYQAVKFGPVWHFN